MKVLADDLEAARTNRERIAKAQREELVKGKSKKSAIRTEEKESDENN